MTRVRFITLIAFSVLWLARDASAQVHVQRDYPASSAVVTQLLVLSGWAIDTRSTSGAGVDQVVVYAYQLPEPAGAWPAMYVGGQTTLNARADVAAAYGPQFVNSGYSIIMSGFAPGDYHVIVYAHSTIDGQWTGSPFLLTVLPSPWLTPEGPAPNAQVSQPFMISGWALDAASTSGIGVDAMAIYAYPNPGSGLPPEYWGAPTMAWTPRPDVAAVFGAQFVDSAWKFDVSGKAPGRYTVVVFMHSTISGTWTLRLFDLWIDLPTVVVTIDRTGTGTGGISGTGLTCPGGAGTHQVPCAGTYSNFATVPITAVPDAGSSFAGWGGACVGTAGATCNVPLFGSQYVTARFVTDTPTQTLTYYHTDAIGSIRATSNAAGAVVARHDYSPFGEDTAPLGGDPKRFAGKDLDVETALQNFEARMYRNTSGRFLTFDPVGGSLTEPQRWNAYAYAGNNPLKFVDPHGMQYEKYDPRECPPVCGDLRLFPVPPGIGGNFEQRPKGPFDYALKDIDGRWRDLFSKPGTAGPIPIPDVIFTPDPPQDPPNPPSPKAWECAPGFVSAAREAWSLAANGTSSVEAGYWLYDLLAQGNLYQYAGKPFTTNQPGQMYIGPPPRGAFAYVHTHPRALVSTPSRGDRAYANRWGIDVYTLSGEGLFIQRKGSAELTNTATRPGTEFTRPCGR